MRMSQIIIYLLLGGMGFFSHAQEPITTNKLEIYIYIDSLDTKTKISVNSFNRDSISYFILKKKMPLEDFEYSLQEIVQNKISKVKRQSWQKKEHNYISLYSAPENYLKVKKINKSNLKNLNVIHSIEIEKIQFKSVLEILKKADSVFIIVEKWINPNEDNLKAYQVKLVEKQGGL